MDLNNYNSIKKKIASYDAQLVAVSKTKPIELILELYNEGQLIFGENKVQELVEKQEALPKNIQWHCIGHLQRNKVKYIASFVSMIHSIDSQKLLFEVNKQAKKHHRKIPVLLQFHIAQEATKFGFNLDEVNELLAERDRLENVEIVGVMGMATFTSDQDLVQSEFKYLKNVFDELKENFFSNQPSFKEISMGMSGDYKLALAEGSTLVRIGSLLFGAR